MAIDATILEVGAEGAREERAACVAIARRRAAIHSNPAIIAAYNTIAEAIESRALSLTRGSKKSEEEDKAGLPGTAASGDSQDPPSTPESVLITLLDADPLALRRLWSEHRPERELEHVAVTLGYSFD